MSSRRGLLIVNLGSPATPRRRDISRFLGDFLSDPRVVNWPRPLWLPILHGIIRPLRPRTLQPVYERIWGRTKSPLMAITARQCAAVARALPDVKVGYAYAYSAPRISHALDAMAAAGVEDLTVIPLYPQYAASTVGAIVDQVGDYYRRQAEIPNLHIVTSYPTQRTYIDWYARAIAARLDAAGPAPTRVVFSFHGVPDQAAHSPRLYRRHCEQTVAAILAHPAAAQITDWELTFQSKFGPGQWLQPATIERMAQLPGEGVERVLVCTPGFITDCIETLDEIEVLNREAFTEAGGAQFMYLNPLNDDPACAQMVAEVFAGQTGAQPPRAEN